MKKGEACNEIQSREVAFWYMGILITRWQMFTELTTNIKMTANQVGREIMHVYRKDLKTKWVLHGKQRLKDS